MGWTPPIVLVVEDSDVERELLTALLAAERYQVRAAADGAAALAALVVTPRPKLVVLNLWMPVMDGFRFLEAARGRGLLDGIAVVTLSALPRREHPQGVAATLEKPIDPPALLAALRRCLAAGGKSTRSTG